MKNIPYQITIRWSETDESYEAAVPALRTCIAYGDTPEEAVHEVAIAAELWLDAAHKHGKPIPKPDATLERLLSLAPLLNLSALARESNISVQTLTSKIKRGTPLNNTERKTVAKVLENYGVR